MPPPLPPRILESPAALRLQSERWRAAGLSVGLVPTMGALHAGHRSLLRRARAECDRVVASIFINPRQFDTVDDFERYPRSVESDIAVLAEERVDAVLLPADAAVYPPGFATEVRVIGPLTESLEGAVRPGHFQGVALMVAKLLVACRADVAYFGQKDAQQCAVVRRLAADLDTGTRIVVCPTVRDADGLALSSRNARLSGAQRAQALALPRGLAAAARVAAAGDVPATRVVAAVCDELASSPELVVEYVAVVDPNSFAAVETVVRGCRIQVAARIGTTRLIDTLCPGQEDAPVVADGLAASAAGAASTGPARNR